MAVIMEFQPMPEIRRKAIPIKIKISFRILYGYIGKMEKGLSGIVPPPQPSPGGWKYRILRWQLPDPARNKQKKEARLRSGPSVTVHRGGELLIEQSFTARY